MVQLANLVTIAAAASVASASQHAKLGAKSAGSAQIKSAIESYANLLTNMADNIGAEGNAPADTDIKGGLDTWMGLMSSFNAIQKADNSTALTPNFEGAIIGAVVSGTLGALAGSLMGTYTDWTFKGFEGGLTNALGFDPIVAITGAPLPALNAQLAGFPLPPLPGSPRPASSPKGSSPKGIPSGFPSAPAPVLGNGSGVPLPKSPVPGVAAPTGAPKAPTPPMPGMAGMGGHGHGA